MIRILDQFKALYAGGNRKAFFNWFQDKSIDKDELKEAENSLEESIQVIQVIFICISSHILIRNFRS